MIKIQIKSVFGNVLFEYEKENNTIKDTVLEAIKQNANLSYANLSDANLSYANLSDASLRGANLSDASLRGANLSYANLSDASLRGANLRGASLSYANLSDANLRGANLSDASLRGASLSKRYIQVSCIGSSKRMTTYCFDDDMIQCGCFIGTLQEFEDKVNKTHKDNKQYLSEYLGFISYVKTLKDEKK